MIVSCRTAVPQSRFLNRRFLVSVSEDKAVKFWDKGAPAMVTFSSDGKHLATAGTIKEGDQGIPEVILWDATSWKRKQTLPDRLAFVRALAFSRDGKTLAIGGGKGDHLKRDGSKTTGEVRLVPME